MFRIKEFSVLVKTMVSLAIILLGAVVLFLGPPSLAAQFPEARIYIEYNSTDNDLGFHVFLDAEDWKTVKIVNPDGHTIFEVAGKGAYQDLGLSELFFEGAEPSLFDFPLEDLLGLFPEGKYTFIGTTVEGHSLMSKASFTHAVPAGPDVSASDDTVSGDTLNICWDPVTEKAIDPAGGIFPDEPINVVAYQVIVDPFQVTIPATDTQMCVTLPTQFVASLSPGTHGFEVLAIDASGNQTITAGNFTK